MKVLCQLILLTILFAASATLAHAHAFLDHAEPKVGSAINASPAKVQIWFTKDIVKSGSSIAVFDAKSAEMDKQDSQIDPDDHSHMSVSIPRLPVGTYKVIWNAVCKDTHHTSGSFTFVVTGP